jgi:hypothetical protein
VGILPYSHTVNVGRLIHNRAAPANSEIEVPAQLQDFVDRGYNNPNDGLGWRGCITERPTVNNLARNFNNLTVPAGANDLMDTPGGNGNPRWQPYFAPSYWRRTVNQQGQASYSALNAYRQPAGWSAMWPHTAAMPKSIFVVESNGNVRAETRDPASNWSNSYNLTRGPNHSCVNQAMLASVSNTREQLKNYIDNQLITQGYTYTDLGTMWGYRMLSPGNPLPSSVGWYDPLIEKAMIVMTDGEITGGTESIGATRIGYTAYGNTHESRVWTSVNEGKWAESHEQRLAIACEIAKAPTETGLPDKLKLYTITFAFNASVQAAKAPLYSNCASSPDKYFNAPNGSALSSAFESIALDLAKLRLTQ